MAAQTFDVIVVGIGGMGSAAIWQLARRGQRVLGLERFDIPHDHGSSHGVTRIIRLAYYEHPDYVPLLKRAFALWNEAGNAFGEKLLVTTGSLDAGAADGEVFQGSLGSCLKHALPHEVLTGAEINARFPGYRLPGDFAGLFQPDGGFVLSERAIVAHATMAMSAGAVVHARERVIEWSPIAGGGVRVKTERGTYEAGRLVLSPGAWIGDLVPSLRTLAVPERQVLGWFQPDELAKFAPAAFPVLNLMVPEGRYYLLPVHGVPGLKIGLYHHFHERGHADALSREVTPADEAVLRRCLRLYFPDADGPVMALHTCMFTNTPDEHFIIDTLPGQPEVVIASPCSGHGYKFASVVGEIIADLATEGRSSFDLSMFRLGRFPS
ncbi:N-methyl-L-tryptophan oxidase [soil metagenome]